MAVDNRLYDAGAALPGGTFAIEASAGTGKTFALVTLAVRFIAEHDVSASQLLMVTFTRAATTELRSRLRLRLVAAAKYLNDDSSSPPDEIFSLLAQRDRSLRLARLRRAISEFDTATITTIHGFATQILSALGTTANTDPDAIFVDDSDELLTAACADVLAGASAMGTAADLLPACGTLEKSTKRAMMSSDTDLVPPPGQPGASEAQKLLTLLVTQATNLMLDRRRHAGTLSYDDLLTQLASALKGSGGQATVRTIRDRFRVALIDEFQDTDSVQWEIFSTLFGRERDDSSLILVGDPKQAIYGFRGANVHAYLGAVQSPSVTHRVLGVNWRSDGALLSALDVLLSGVTFGDADIAFAHVEPAEANVATRLTSAEGADLPALSIRLALGSDLSPDGAKPNAIAAPVARSAIIDADLVAYVRQLLDGALLPASDSSGQGRPVRPSDIAVLVRSQADSLAVQKSLLAQGIPAVQARGSTVLKTPAAAQWRCLLAALIRPSDAARARAFALSWFGGWDAPTLDAAGEVELAALQGRLLDWAETLTGHGVAPFVRQVMAESGVVARVLLRPDGDRHVTDLQHLGELFQSVNASQRVSVAGLLAVLDVEPVEEGDTDTDGDVTARRIESEAQAVQVMTIWVAKGLQFPIVCVPTMWSTTAGAVIYQDATTGRRTYDLANGSGWPDKKRAEARKAQSADEALGEHLRLLYVALTRAQHHTAVWWARIQGSERSSLARVLFARTEGRIDQEKFGSAKFAGLPDDADVEAFLEPLVQQAGGNLVVTRLKEIPPAPARWSTPEGRTSRSALALARLEPVPDRSPQRWSFTAMTHVANMDDFDPQDTSLGDRGAGDESVGPDSASTGLPADGSKAGVEPGTPPMSLLPAGPAFGTLVHAILEKIDFRQDDLRAALRREIDLQLVRTPFDLTPSAVLGPSAVTGPELLVDGLADMIASPLGQGFGGRTLAEIDRVDRIDEMSFEIRLGDGGHRNSVRDIGRLLVGALPENDPFIPWARGVADGSTNITLAGHLTGSIDAVFRTLAEDGASRFVVVDYKTNRLSEPRRPPSPDDYRSVRMGHTMAEHGYPLQALLYSVALHRYLRGRLPGYDPERNLGGAAYLFVRGMTGAAVPQDAASPPGVYHWHIPAVVIGELSDLLHGHSMVNR